MQGCQIGFFEAKFKKSGFFKIRLASQNSFGFLAFSWPFYMLKLSARKWHTILFLNHFPLRKMFFGHLHLAIFLPPTVWARRRQSPTGKLAEHGGHVTRPGTVAPVCLGPPKCLAVIYTNLPCQVYCLYEITCCGEIVTPSAVFINHFLWTAKAMLSNKWRASYDSNRKYSSK